MSEASSSVGFDGTRYVLTSTVDGAVKTARLAAGTHTNADHDAALVSLRGAYTTLRQWSVDAQTVVNGWTGTTYTATKDAQLKETVRRLGVFFDRFADLMVAMNVDR